MIKSANLNVCNGSKFFWCFERSIYQHFWKPEITSLALFSFLQKFLTDALISFSSLIRTSICLLVQVRIQVLQRPTPLLYQFLIQQLHLQQPTQMPPQLLLGTHLLPSAQGIVDITRNLLVSTKDGERRREQTESIKEMHRFRQDRTNFTNSIFKAQI